MIAGADYLHHGEVVREDWPECGLPATGKRASRDFKAKVALEALEEALSRYGKPEICDTGQDRQFTGFAFTGVLQAAQTEHGWQGMDNVFIERLCRSLTWACA